MDSSINEEEKNKEKKISIPIKKDSDMEKVIRSLAIIEGRESCNKLYSLYKKAHNMPVF